MATWQCVKNCGACCQLDPADRPDLADYLSPAQLSLYMSMVGEDGWCINYDQTSRECSIYADRPVFCRVEPETFKQLYEVEPTDLNEFAIECCEQQISGVYGDRSPEMDRFYQAVGIESQVIDLTPDSWMPPDNGPADEPPNERHDPLKIALRIDFADNERNMK